MDIAGCLEGRTAFITGGARGIGLGIARTLASHGVKLALADTDGSALEAAKCELAGSTQTEVYVLDVRDRSRFADLAREVECRLGAVSLLFNNAGIASAVPMDQLSYESWDSGLGVNLGGVVNGIQTWLPRMLKRNSGHIVNTASIAGLAVGRGGADIVYHAAKYGVVGLSESLREELARCRVGVRVSVICPGRVDTAILHNTVGAHPELSSPRPKHEEMQQALSRGSSPDDVGRVIVEKVCGGAFFILTDAQCEQAVKARTDELMSTIRAL